MDTSKLVNTLYEHRFTIGALAWYIFSGLIVTMPGKDEPFKVWPWFYDFTHLLLNLKPVPAFKQTEQLHQISDQSGVIKTDSAKTTEQAANTGVTP